VPQARLIATRFNYAKAKIVPPVDCGKQLNSKGNFSGGIFEKNALSDISEFAGN